MLNNFKDLAVQYVKTIVDCNRCGLCDRSDGTRMRFVCGHSACTECVTIACECPICTPLMDARSSHPQTDEPLTERAKLATELLTTFQDAFDIDVYRRQRISEQLKVEKELFPECIQAPITYSNKRKSLNSSKNKENSYTFAGEGITSKRELTMNKSRSYVQEWLQKQTTPSSAPRSPFSDLQVNTHHNSPVTKHITAKGKGKQNGINQPTRQSNRKRSRLRQSLKSNSQSGLENYLKPVEKSQSKNTWMSAKRLKKVFSENAKGLGQDQVQNKVDNKCDESAIVIDDDCIAIEDTQDQVMDKDRLAQLAVAHADRQQKNKAASIVEVEDGQVMHDVNWEKHSTPIVINEKEKAMNKTPFYRKSYLFKNCRQCIGKNNGNLISPEPCDESSKRDTDISIKVENKTFVTIITVADCHEVGSNKKRSTSVQTDTEEPFLGFDQPPQKDETVNMISKIQEYIESEAMFTEDVASNDSQKTRCTEVMLTNNDAGSNLASRDILVGHHNENGVLTESGAGFRTRKRKPPRGVTPDSTNSSDKENCDPNRKKKHDSKKKKKAHK